MSEAYVIQNTSFPVTVESLHHDLEILGVRPGMVLLVHSSLSAIGWVCGGPVAVILALRNALGPTGTLVMPAHSADLTEPSKWREPPVPETWWPVIRKNMPAYDPDLTPARSMGIIAETFRNQNGALRSAHPQHSFCAVGPRASFITDGHTLEFGMGERSPLARIYELDGHVLLLGVDHSRNTSMHLAEYRASYPSRCVVEEGAPLSAAGASGKWTTFEDINLDSSDFGRIGEDLLRSQGGGGVSRGEVGQAHSQLMRQRDVVDYTVEWLGKNRRK